MPKSGSSVYFGSCQKYSRKIGMRQLVQKERKRMNRRVGVTVYFCTLAYIAIPVKMAITEVKM